MFKPLHRKVVVFTIKNRKRLLNNSGLYLPDSRIASMCKAEDIWVAVAADDCRSEWKTGSHLLVSDAFEFGAEFGEPISWEDYKHLPEFDAIKRIAESVEGEISSTAIPEDSFIAEVHGYMLQEHSNW